MKTYEVTLHGEPTEQAKSWRYKSYDKTVTVNEATAIRAIETAKASVRTGLFIITVSGVQEANQ